MRVAVFIGAHADDIELGAGGTCAKLCALGVEVHVVIGTDEADATVAAARRREAVAAAAELGVPADRVHFLGFSDGAVRCDRASVGRVRALLSQARIRPDAVFTHTEWDSHQDHVELTRIVRGAVRQAVIFKYVVRNSAIVSHFNPCVYSAVDDFLAAKSAALCKHRSQVAVGRVDVQVLLNFARRYSFNLENRHFEAYEIEVQEGVEGFLDLLDRVNDAPFSRLWQPICTRAGVVVMASDAKPGEQRSARRAAVISRAPGELQLVTRLQAELVRLMQGLATSNAVDMLAVAPTAEAGLGALGGRACLLLGGPATNSVACGQLRERDDLCFPMAAAADGRGGSSIVDRETGQVFEARTSRTDDGIDVLAGDYGLLTMFRGTAFGGPSGATSGGPLLICADGIQQAGIAAAVSCLTRMDHVARIVEEARAVIDGSAQSAQWLIPCDGAGVPEIDGVLSVVRGARALRGRAVSPRRLGLPQQLAAAG